MIRIGAWKVTIFLLLVAGAGRALANEPRVLEGRLEVVISDQSRSSITSYRLRLPSGETMRVRLAPGAGRGLRSDDWVRLHGDWDGTDLIVETGRIERMARAVSPEIVGPQEFLYLIVNFQDNKTVPVDTESLRRIAFEMPRSITRFYQESSFGQVTIAGEVHGVYTLPSLSNGRCDMDRWVAEAKAAAKAAGVAVAKYHHVVVVLPQNDGHSVANSCLFHGIAQVGGESTWALINYHDGFPWGPETAARLIAHEQGHNFGLGHASSLLCNEGATTLGTEAQCHPQGYGDSTDDMGGQYQQFNALHKLALGWISRQQVQSVTSSGTYEVYSSDRKENGVQLLKIPKPETDQFYFLNYRTNGGQINYGFGDGLGVYVYLGDELPSSSSQVLYIHPTLPIGGAIVDPLLNGESFYDRASGIRVTQLDHNGLKATIRIELK